MKVSDLLKKLIAKAGIEFTGEITDELPDETATALDNSLLTIKAATNNHPEVRKVYVAQALNGADARIEQLMSEFGFDEETMAAIKAEETTFKRIDSFAKKIKELGDKKAQATDPGKVTSLQQQINDLHAKVKAEQDAAAALKTTYEGQIKGIHIQSKLSSILGGYKTVYDELPADAKEAAINALLQKNLQDSAAEFTFDENGNLAIVKKDGTNLFGDNHTQLTPTAFIDKSLSKILKVTTPANPGNPIKPTNGNHNPAQPEQQPNTALNSLLSESLQQYEAAVK